MFLPERGGCLIDVEDVTIVIPTWNSMPELKETLESIQYAFPGNPEIIVVDRDSTDDTQICAKKYGCIVLRDVKSLGSARLKGVRYAKTDWICFIDSDIVLPENWFSDFMEGLYYVQATHLENFGMAFGITIDTQDKMQRMQMTKLLQNLNPVIINKGERAWTNNTFILKELVVDAPITNVNAWEDWLIAQNVMKHGYGVVRLPIPVKHNHNTVSKWGFIKSGWNAKGMLDVVGLNWYTFKYMNYYLVEGLRATIGLKDLYYLKWGFLTWREVWQGILSLKTYQRN